VQQTGREYFQFLWEVEGAGNLPREWFPVCSVLSKLVDLIQIDSIEIILFDKDLRLLFELHHDITDKERSFGRWLNKLFVHQTVALESLLPVLVCFSREVVDRICPAVALFMFLVRREFYLPLGFV